MRMDGEYIVKRRCRSSVRIVESKLILVDERVFYPQCECQRGTYKGTRKKKNLGVVLSFYYISLGYLVRIVVIKKLCFHSFPHKSYSQSIEIGNGNVN